MNHHSIFPSRQPPAPKPLYTNLELCELGAILNTLPHAGERPVTQTVVREALAQRPRQFRLVISMDGMRTYLNHLKDLGMVERSVGGDAARKIVFWAKTYRSEDTHIIAATGQIPIRYS